MHLFPTRQIALSLGPLAIHWYGLMYLAGFLIGIWLLPRLEVYRSLSLTERQRSSLFVHVILGVLVGGRIGYVLFYGLSEYLAHPLEIVAVWHGGMSSHGGIVGVVLALLLFTRREEISFLALTDLLVIPIAIGLALGRIGNFINGELYGTVTTLPWGMRFPGVEGLRHPAQLYAVAKDLCIAALCFLHLKETAGKSIGQTSALFLMLYGVLRFLVEYLREQPFGFTQIGPLAFSRGQLLTIPVFIVGILLWFIRSRSEFRAQDS